VHQRVVILNGPAGVGRTTVGRLLARRAPNGVCIHGDTLADFIVTRVDGVVETGLGCVNGATVAANFIRAGYDLVVFEYCLESGAHVRRFLDAYDAAAPVSLFTLWAPFEVIVEREQERVGRGPLGARVEACYRSIGSNLGELGQIVPNVGAPEGVAAVLDELSAR
jgi:predicted ABC-type ATPase